MQGFTQKIVQMMKSERLFASQGGPIILSQVSASSGTGSNCPNHQDTIQFERVSLCYVCSRRANQLERVLPDIDRRAKNQLQLLIVILLDYTVTYGTIKRICETGLGIVSQCCKPNHVKRGQKQYLENVALKINVKAGGSNSVLVDAISRKIPRLTDCSTIFFGADVTHASPGEDCSASIEAAMMLSNE